jgi:hypothetical protein
MRSELRQECNKCIPCMRFDIKSEGYHPARSIEATQVWDHVQMDLVGPLPPSEKGYSYVMTLVDVMSGYCILRAIKGKSAKDVAKVLWKVICEYGTMKILQSDLGPEFVNKVVQDMTEMFHIDHRLITAYHPRADGLVE